MTKLITRIVFPEITEEDLLFAKKYIKNFISKFIVLAYTVCWRAQIAQTQTKETISKKDLQGTPSMKYIAKLFNSVEDINDLLAAITVKQSSFFDQKDYVATPTEQRDKFVISRINDLKSPGKSKLLSPRQISSYEELLVHRRGLMAKLRGKLQATTLYSPGSIIKGLNVSYLTWEQFVTLCTQTLENMDIKDPLADLKNELEITDKNTINNPCEILTLSIRYSLHDSEDAKELNFEDGIIVTNEETNIVPLETIFKVTRLKPVILIESVLSDTDDIFIKSVKKQQAELMKSDKSLFLKEQKPTSKIKRKRK